MLLIKKRNTGGAAVYPAPKPLIPTVFSFNGQDGSSIRALGEQ